MSGVVRGAGCVFRPRLEGVVRGESGRNELLRGPFALFGVRSSAKLVRNLAKHRRTPMSPPQLIPPTSPGQVFAGDGRLRRRFSRHRTWSVPGTDLRGPLELSSAMHFTQSGSALRRLYLRPQPQTTTSFTGTKDSYTPHHPACWPYRQRPHLLN